MSLAWYWQAYENLGLPSLVQLQARKLYGKVRPPARPYRLRSKHAAFPLSCRPHTSDLVVFHQIFVGREYRCLDHIARADLIIDCGANVGFSAAYLLSRFRQAQLIAIEPDAGNFASLQRNLRPYGARARALRAAVWSDSVGLVMDERTEAAGAEWSRRVRPAAAGERPAIEAVDIPSLLASSGRDRISILKVDIEGAEQVVFGQGCEGWLGRVDNLVIELHGRACEQVFMRAIAPHGFVVSTCDELTVCMRPH